MYCKDDVLSPQLGNEIDTNRLSISMTLIPKSYIILKLLLLYNEVTHLLYDFNTLWRLAILFRFAIQERNVLKVVHLRCLSL